MTTQAIDLTAAERDLLAWLARKDFSQYGEPRAGEQEPLDFGRVPAGEAVPGGARCGMAGRG